MAKRRPLYLLMGVSLLLGVAVACDSGDDDDGADPSEDGGGSTVDGGRDAGMDGGPREEDSGRKDGGADGDIPDPEPDAEVGCRSDAECQNDSLCDGPERCVAGQCLPSIAPKVCTRAHPCAEDIGDCDCRKPSADGDDYAAVECGGTDCDDTDPLIYKGADEVCDRYGVDEDCDGTTISSSKNPRDGDEDVDGFVSTECFNIDRSTGRVFVIGGKEARGDDCDDRQRTINPGAAEICDGRDNNCNGYTDEVLGVDESNGMLSTFYQDLDNDGFGNPDMTFLGCPGERPGYVGQPGDCDDDPLKGGKINTAALELCDGADNDCDGKTDAADDDLVMTVEFEDTTVICEGGKEKITQCPVDRAWCAATAIRGCETDATRLSSCRACPITDCRFACGQEGCEEVVELALGDQFSCGRTREGRASCWGRGAGGRLGNDGVRGSTQPDLVVGLADVVQIAVGEAHACAVVGSGREAYCWGANDERQLGNDEVDAVSLNAVAVTGVSSTRLTGVEQLSLGKQHSCALLTEGGAACWGSREDGRLGDASVDTEPSVVPMQVTRMVFDELIGIELPAFVDDARAVSVGERHACLLTAEGKVDCWGDNRAGQLGAPPADPPSSNVAVRVPGLEGVTQIAAGSASTCARLGSGEVRCWGSNARGQLGRASTAEDYLPAPVAGLPMASSVAVGAGFACAVSDAHEAWCWGANDDRALGVLTPAQSAEPVKLPLQGIEEVATFRHGCARSAQQVFCWGSNSFGQLGRGQASQTAAAPAPILPLTGSKR